MDLIITILPVVTKDLPLSPRFTPYDFLSRCKFSTFTTRQSMVAFLLTHVPTLSVTKERTQILLGKNRTHDFRTSRCAGYLLDHSYILLIVCIKIKTPNLALIILYCIGCSGFRMFAVCLIRRKNGAQSTPKASTKKLAMFGVSFFSDGIF